MNTTAIPPRTRKPRIDVALLDRAMAVAQRTSISNASRATGLATITIRNEMKRRGIPSRRPGNYTAEEHDRVLAHLVP